jgi:Flp pilus assembly protein TadG
MTRRGLSRLLRDRSGVAAVEATMVISLVLVPLCLGVAAYAMVLADTAQLDRALQAGLFYVWSNPTGFTTSGVRAAAAAGFDNTSYVGTSPALTVTASSACYCVSSSAVKGAAVSCTGSCATGQTIGTYVTVTASAAFTLPVVVQTLTSPLTQSVTGTVRTQ